MIDCEQQGLEHPNQQQDIVPRHLPTTPRNINLKKMRSLRGRALEDKYAVDWKTVLGEGAYGSVHPARLRSTGEKVRASERVAGSIYSIE